MLGWAGLGGSQLGSRLCRWVGWGLVPVVPSHPGGLAEVMAPGPCASHCLAGQPGELSSENSGMETPEACELSKPLFTLAEVMWLYSGQGVEKQLLHSTVASEAGGEVFVTIFPFICYNLNGLFPLHLLEPHEDMYTNV